jgi:hypothetical protein
MGSAGFRPVLRSVADYRVAVRRATALRKAGATADTNEELAALEGAIALYVAKPGQPDWRKGRPKDRGGGM